MIPASTFSYRPSGTVILMGRASARGRGGHCFELRWFRYVDNDGEVTDQLLQQHWSPRCVLTTAELGGLYGSTPAEAFAEFTDRYRRVTEDADGIPAPGQLGLPGV